MNTLPELSHKEAYSLLDTQEEILFSELGARAVALGQGEIDQSALGPALNYADHLGAMDALKKVGLRMFEETHRQAYGLLCGTKGDDLEDRSRITTALGIGAEATIIALTSVLVGTFGIAAALAGILAALIYKRFIGPSVQAGHQSLCESWSEYLPQTDQLVP